MKIQFSDCFQDYVELVWVDSKLVRFWVILSGVVFFLPLLVLTWINPPRVTWIGFYLNPCVIFVGLAALGGKYYWAWQRWRNRMQSEDQTTCEFSEMGLRSITPNTDVTLLWADLTEYRETSTLFLLRMPSGRYTFIPKRAFTDDIQRQAFRDLLSSHIGNQTAERMTLPERPAGISVSRPYRLEINDYLESYNAIASSSMRLFALFIRGLLVVYVLWRIYNLISDSPSFLSMANLTEEPLRKWIALILFHSVELMWLVLLTCFAFGNYLFAFLQYRKQPKSQQIGIDSEGVSIQAGTVSNTLKWEFLGKFIETQNLFLLQSRTKGAFAIPKRAFNDETQQQFRALLSQKLNPSG